MAAAKKIAEKQKVPYHQADNGHILFLPSLYPPIFDS